MWGLEFACATAKKYGTGWDSRRRNFAKENGEPEFKVGQLVEFQVADEVFQGPVTKIRIEWELESWVYDVDVDVEEGYRNEVPECVLSPIDVVERLAKLVQ